MLVVAYSVYGLAVTIPTIALAARRVHDGNLSAWWLLLYLLPFLGTLAV